MSDSGQMSDRTRRIESQRELDRTILAYVRGMQSAGRVTRENVLRYVRGPAGLRDANEFAVQDRLDYLASAADLTRERAWDAAVGCEVEGYRVTYQGMDRQDGILPPHGYQGTV